MPPGRKRRTKTLAGSGESAASTVVDDSTSGGEGEVTGSTVRSPPRSKARLGSPRKEGGSEECSGSAYVATTGKAVARLGSPRQVGGSEGGSGSCGGGGSANVATAVKAVARTGSPPHEGEIEGGSGSRGGRASVTTAEKTVAQPSMTVGKETGAGRAKEAAKKREYSHGAVVVGGGEVSHVAAAKLLRGSLTRSMPALSAPMPAPPAPVLEAITPVAPKPVETWSVVDRSKGPATSSNEVIKKVVKE
ncbi:translation initiation factor IF-2-like, partial [Bactrocera neohumeralis]|uniref:translation initiation factor IF-2-like n=1 Tax=Bactrocera neohumeralis TaxID=98809 RepID=UPI0021654DBE